MASATATTNGANEHDAAAIARTAGGLLAIHAVQSKTVGNELSLEEDPCRGK